MAERGIGQAIYNLQRASDYYIEGEASLIAGDWKDSDNKPISISSNQPTIEGGNAPKYPIIYNFPTGNTITKIGIQALPKTNFSFIYGDGGATEVSMIVGRSGIYEIELPQGDNKLQAIKFYATETISGVDTSNNSINLTNAITKLHKLQFLFVENLKTEVIDGANYYYSFSNPNSLFDKITKNDSGVYQWSDTYSDGSPKKPTLGKTYGIQFTNTGTDKYWDRYDEIYQSFSTAYGSAYLEYKKALYGTYAVTEQELSNIIVDYEYKTGGVS